MATSNRPPEDLYKGGLNRALFMPAIELILERCGVHGMEALSGGVHTDYRQAVTPSDVQMVYSPLGAGAERGLAAVFAALVGAGGGAGGPAAVPVMMGRTLQIPLALRGVARTDFMALCGQPLGAADYLALAGTFHTLLISGVPAFSINNANQLRRFIVLVDVLYERQVRSC